MIPPLARRMYQVTYRRTSGGPGTHDFITVVPALTMRDAISQASWQLQEKYPVAFVDFSEEECHRYRTPMPDPEEGAPA